jgi:endonuclease/exonuclease/phosphatase (EEP) superfamily protein YafD
VRWQRIVAWLALFSRPAANRRLEWMVRVLSLSYLGGALGAAGLLWIAGDVWWPATVLLFGPRWTLLLPLGMLVPGALHVDRSLLLPLVVAALVVVGPVMGFVTGWRGLVQRSPAGGPEVGVVTFNARGGEGLRLTATGMLQEWGADIAAFQECQGTLRAELEALPRTGRWHTDRRASLCLASRFPIVGVQEMDREDFEFARGSGLVATWSLLLEGGDTVRVTNLHLETPRAGLARIRRGRIGAGIRLVEEKSFLRTLELERAHRWALAYSGPHIVLGDFNTPVESRTYRQAWGGWQNAFSHAGFGLGGTRLNGWIRARIDHVLVDAAWQVAHAAPGRDLGSDHLPMKATLLRNSP